MSVHQYANNPSTTLSGSATSGATSISVSSATGFPSQGKFTIIVDSEIMLVTGVSGTTFTVTRGHESTTAAAHNNNATVTQILTVDSFLNSHWADVRAFGATGDGTTDDLTAFQDAHDSLPSDGGVIFIPAGEYLLSDSWELTRDNIHVELDPQAIIYTDGATTDGHTLAFIGPGTGNALTPQQAFASINGGTVKNVNNSTSDNAIGFVRYEVARCTNVRIPECGKKAITAQYGVEKVIFTDNIIGETGSNAISIESSGGRVYVENNYIADAGAVGILISNPDGTAAGKSTQVHILNNVIASTTNAIDVSDADRVTIAGNHIPLAVGKGINLDTVTAIEIRGNTITSTTAGHLIQADACGDTIIEGNLLGTTGTGSTNTYSQIVFTSATARWVVSNNLGRGTTHKHCIYNDTAGASGTAVGNVWTTAGTSTYGGGQAPILGLDLVNGTATVTGTWN